MVGIEVAITYTEHDKRRSYLARFTHPKIVTPILRVLVQVLRQISDSRDLTEPDGTVATVRQLRAEMARQALLTAMPSLDDEQNSELVLSSHGPEFRSVN